MRTAWTKAASTRAQRLMYFEQWDEVELGYVLEAAAQGKGFAAEGSSAWIAHARTTQLAYHLIAAIHPGNDASIGLATTLGFAFDREDVMPSGTPTLIYRLDL